MFTTVQLCAQDAKHRHVIVNQVAVASPPNQLIHPVTNAVMFLSLLIPMLRHRHVTVNRVAAASPLTRLIHPVTKTLFLAVISARTTATLRQRSILADAQHPRALQPRTSQTNHCISFHIQVDVMSIRRCYSTCCSFRNHHVLLLPSCKDASQPLAPVKKNVTLAAGMCSACVGYIGSESAGKTQCGYRFRYN